ncbi:MAG: response regulator, partial [Thermodesulfovibrionales bacterium]|nr:response regulator [Thermodesulfovibrionales bacterium]
MKTALIIEDNPDNTVLMERLLSKAGYKTIHAATGLEGINKVLDEKPDFILLDIQLPDIDGTEVLKRIRQHEDCKSIPIIAVTSYAMAGDRARLLSAGCDGYIEKPIDPISVINQIKSILGD